jgi:TatD DNase family protein
MWPPDEMNPNPLTAEGKPINHPANLIVSYQLLAKIRDMPLQELISQIAENYVRLFGNR